MSIVARPVVAARAPWVRRDSGLPPFCRTERYATHQLSLGTRNDPQFEYTPALPGITRYEITPCFPGSNNVRPPRTIPRRPDLRGVTGARGGTPDATRTGERRGTQRCSHLAGFGAPFPKRSCNA